MDTLVRKLGERPGLVLGVMMVRGMLEFVALQRSHWKTRVARHTG